MKTTLAISQMSVSKDYEENIKKATKLIREAKSKGADLILLQELFERPYFCQIEDYERFDYAEEYEHSKTLEYFQKLAKEFEIVLPISFFEKSGNCYYNSICVIDKDGERKGLYRKTHIPTGQCYEEKFYFTPGDLSFTPIDTSLGRLGVLVCWDQWYPEAARLMALNGAELLIYPTAIGWESTDTPEEKARQREAWITVQRGHAVANGLPVISVNRVGHEEDPSHNTNGIQFWGSSFVAGPQGEFIYQASDSQPETAIIEVSTVRTEQVRRWWPFLRDRRIDHYGNLTKRYID